MCLKNELKVSQSMWKYVIMIQNEGFGDKYLEKQKENCVRILSFLENFCSILNVCLNFL